MTLPNCFSSMSGGNTFIRACLPRCAGLSRSKEIWSGAKKISWAGFLSSTFGKGDE